MLTQYIRVLYSDDGTITDRSLANADRTATIPFEVVAAEDYLYVGQYFTFGNLFFNIDTANSNSSALSIDYWTGNKWVSAVDVLDGTSSSGVSIAQSGVVQWSTDKDESGWQRVSDPTDEETALGFTSLKIYDLYWIRISFSADFSASTDLLQIGYKFCTDADVSVLAPDINDYLTTWGVSDWTLQILEASKQVVADLKARNIIGHSGQLIRFDDINIPTAYKTLAIIYDGLGGQDFREMRNEMEVKYRELIGKAPIIVDDNKDLRQNSGETGLDHGRVYR